MLVIILVLFLTHIEELTVFAFSYNLSAENSKFSAVSGNLGNRLLECMLQGDQVPLVDSDAGILLLRTKAGQEPLDHPREIAHCKNSDESEGADIEQMLVSVLLIFNLLQHTDSPTCV